MSSDPRRHLHLSSSSSRTHRSSHDDEGETWLDFLRSAGGSVALERSDSSDRKRRHAGSSPERPARTTSYHPSFNGRRPSDRSTTQQNGSSRDRPIDLTSPPPRQRPPIPERMSGSNDNLGVIRNLHTRPTLRSVRGSFTGRRDSSDIILPRWQPDSDSSRCPVCQTQFGFWYRKHHCRKCGRVVCAACSPHRITIPRQYIVQPPNTSDSETSPTSPQRSGNLGGGEVVRVCNPCVPDPWTPDTASDAASRAIPEERGSRERAPSPQRPDRYRPVPPLPPYDPSRHRTASHQPGSSFSRSLPQGQPPPGFVFREPYNRPPPVPPAQSRAQIARNLLTSHPLPAHPAAQPQQPTNRPAAVTLPSAQPQPARPRREVREEDECPVCGSELPPGDNIREAHIQECIMARFSSTPSTSAPIAPPRGSSVASPTIAPTASSLPNHSTTPQSADSASRPRATSYRPRGMAVYKATEKDCMNEDGEPQECVICFEEFQPGDDMGRMECLCKFHRTCIRSWWETKGAGSCPTHMLHE